MKFVESALLRSDAGFAAPSASPPVKSPNHPNPRRLPARSPRRFRYTSPLQFSPVRRSLSLAVLLLFCWPLAASALALATDATFADSRLPMCCRRNGVHHCSGGMGASTDLRSATLRPVCPALPSATASTRPTDLILPALALPAVATRRTLASIILPEPGTARSLNLPHPQRGPPSRAL